MFNLFRIAAFLSFSAFAVPVHAGGVPMLNELSVKGDGTANSAYLQQIKDIMIFQVAGWSGLASESDSVGALVWEPNLFGGYAQYSYLAWMLGQQP